MADDNDNDLGSALGHLIEDVQEEGFAEAGKKLLGGLLGGALQGALNAFGDEASSDDSGGSDDATVVNNAGGNYSDSQVASRRDHDVDDDIDGDTDDTSGEDNDLG